MKTKLVSLNGRKLDTQKINLHLVLTYYWFDELKNGTKSIEYRKMSEHWRRLIWDRKELISSVTFQRGYTQNRLTLKVSRIDKGECPYPGWDSIYYRIHVH